MENKEKNSKKAIGKIIDILIKINDSSIEKVAEELGIFNIIMLNYVKGLSMPKEEHIDKVCEMFGMEKDLFYYFVSYYDSTNNYEDDDRFKLTISYILELTFNNRPLKKKGEDSFLDDGKDEVKSDNLINYIKCNNKI